MKPYKFPVSHSETPAHAVYPYITNAYRSGGGYADNIKSLFQLHTETVNAWSMIIANVGSFYASVMANNMILYIFTASALLHLPFSVGYHLFMSMDENIFNLWRRLDIIGIYNAGVLITFALGYYVFPLGICLANTLLAACVAGYASMKAWRMNAEHVIDGATQVTFIGMIVACYLSPMYVAAIRDIAMHGAVLTVSVISPIAVTGVLGFGGWAYATFWPQRIAPGKFNVWLHSHQIMHICIIICHAFEYLFILENMKYVRPLDFLPSPKQHGS